MVIYDGEFLCVQLTRGKDYKVVLDIARNSEYSEYIPKANIYCVPPTRKNARLLNEAGYPFDDSAKIFLKEHKKEHHEESEAVNLPKGLFPFQKEGVERMLNMNGNILLADEMGLGKTVQGAVYLAKKENSLPALIICPASLKQNWANEIKKWVGVDSYILEGKKSQFFSKEFYQKYPVFIINYDVLGYEDKKEKEAEMKRRKRQKEINAQIEIETGKKLKVKKKEIPVHGWCEELSKIPFNTIMADEVQYISESEAIRTRAINLICSKNPSAKKLFISGTPYETKTAQFFNILHILKPKYFPDKWKYLFRYCNPKKNRYGWQFDGLSNASELNQIISKFMIRRLKKDVLTQLPPKIRAVVPMHVSSADRSIYDDFDAQFLKDIKNGDKSRKELIGHISHLKEKAYEAKASAVINWIKEYLDSSDNRKLVVFIYHISVFDSLMKEFGNKAVGINGSTPPKDRQDIVDRFQNDDSVEIFIGQIKACGVGLTLTKASATCFVEFGSTAVQHEQAEDRVHRIGQKADSVMAYYLILDNSIENDIMYTLERRNKDLKKVLNDEDEASLFNDMKEEIFSEYKKRKKV